MRDNPVLTANPIPPPKTIQSNRLWRGKDVLIIGLGGIMLMLILMLVPLAIYFGLNRGLLRAALKPQDLLVISMVSFAAEAVGLVIAVAWLGLSRRHISWAQIGLRPISGSWLLGSFALTVFAAVIGGAAAVLVQFLLTGNAAAENPQTQAIAPAGFSWSAAIAMTFLGGVAVPIGEELFFRGVLHRWASDKWGAGIGSLLSSAIFGVSHGFPAIIAFAFVMGLAIAYANEKTRSLWPGIIIHIINNSLKIALLYGVLAAGLPI